LDRGRSIRQLLREAWPDLDEMHAAVEPLLTRIAPERLPGFARELPFEEPWFRQKELPPHWTLRALFSFSRSGYEREAAVRGMPLHDGRELKFLVLRLTDHVRQVREAAKNAIEARLQELNYAVLVELLPLLELLSRRSRADFEFIYEVLRRPESLPALRAAMDSRATFHFARHAFPDEAVRLGLGSGNPAVRLRAAREAPELLEPLLQDSFAPVRERALRAFPSAANLERALLDSSAGIRSFARKHLPKERALAIYRAAPKTPSAILGLAEVGDESDAVDLFLLDDSRSRVREAVAIALAKLAGDEAIEPLLTFLESRSPRVVRKAQKLLSRRVDPQKLWELQSVPALQLLARVSKWDSLEWLLRAVDVPPLREAALDLLRRWPQMKGGEQRPIEKSRAARLRRQLAQVPLDLTTVDFELAFFERA
jgi:HEAT repeat protein